MKQFLCIISCMLLIALLIPSPAFAGKEEAIGTVVAVRGEVTAVAGTGAKRELALKGPIFRDDTVRTGSGRVQLMFSDNTLISLGQESEMVVSEYDWQPDGKSGAMKTRIKEGTFRVMGGAITKVAPGNFSTETPAATIGIRGSMYAGQATSDSLVVVFQGGKGIDITNALGTVAITKPGFGTRVPGLDRPPLPPVRFTAEDLNAINTGLKGGPAAGKGQKGKKGGQKGKKGGPKEKNDPDASSEDSGNEGQDSEQQATDGDSGNTSAQSEGEPTGQDEATGSADGSGADSPTGSGKQQTEGGQGTDEGRRAVDEPLTFKPAKTELASPSSSPVSPSGFPTGFPTGPNPAPPPDVRKIVADIKKTVTDVQTDNTQPDNQSVVETVVASTDWQLETILQMMPDGQAAALLASMPDLQIEPVAASMPYYHLHDITGTEVFGDGQGKLALFADGYALITQADGTVISSLTITGYKPDALYQGPIPLNPVGMIITGPNGQAYTAPARFEASPSGGFIYGYVDSEQFIEGQLRNVNAVSFSGTPTPAALLPTGDQVDTYSGKLAHYSLSLRDDDGETENFSMEVNWRTGAFIGRINEEAGDEGTFFFGHLNRSNLSGSDIFLVDNYFKWYEPTGTTNFQQPLEEYREVEAIVQDRFSLGFYGKDYEGFGFTGSGRGLALADLRQLDSWKVTGAGLREIEPDEDIDRIRTPKFEGFVAGRAEDIAAPSPTTSRVFMNDSADCLTLQANDNGTIRGWLRASEISTENDLDGSISLDVGGANPSAYVLNDQFIAMMGCSTAPCIESFHDPYPNSPFSTTGTLKPYNSVLASAGPDLHYMITTAPGNNVSRDPEFLRWGYWQMAYSEPQAANGTAVKTFLLHDAMWVAGTDRTTLDQITNVRNQFGNQQVSYSGGAIANMLVDGEGFRILRGTTRINVNFATYSLSAKLTFPSHVLDYSGSFNSGGSFTFTNAAGKMSGAFFGPRAEEVGGNFSQKVGSSRYLGIFGGAR